MSRLIKFRAWDTDRKKMLKPFDLWNVADMCLQISEIIATRFGTLEIMQFTGQKDNCEKEIYESDILSITFPNGEIIDGVEVIWDFSSCKACVNR